VNEELGPFQQLAHMMYVSLKAMPCRCLRKWNKEKKEGYEITNVCSRCMAIDAYEAQVPQLIKA
jgi:hypothetical protein